MTSMAVDLWNRLYPICTPVLYFPLKDSNECISSKTRSKAWNLKSDHPVVLIEGKTGGVSLEHLVVIATPSRKGDPPCRP